MSTVSKTKAINQVSGSTYNLILTLTDTSWDLSFENKGTGGSTGGLKGYFDNVTVTIGGETIRTGRSADFQQGTTFSLCSGTYAFPEGTTTVSYKIEKEAVYTKWIKLPADDSLDITIAPTSYNLTIQYSKYDPVQSSQETGSSVSQIEKDAEGIVVANYLPSFAGWHINSYSPKTIDKMDSDKTGWAIYYNYYSLAVSAGTGGSIKRGVDSENGWKSPGTVIYLEAIPNDGHAFSGWSDGDTNAVKYFNINSDVTLTANFAKTVQLVVYVENDGYGASGYFEDNYDPGARYYEYAHYIKPENSTITLTATPSSDSIFYAWTSYAGPIISEDNTITVKFDDDKIIYANFVYPVLTLKTSPTDWGSAAISGHTHGHLPLNSQQKIIATPNSGYNFDGWYKGGSKESSSRYYTITLTGDVTYTANFKLGEFDWINTISSGEPITNLTADDWWNIQSKIDLVRGTAYNDWLRATSPTCTHQGGTYTYLTAAMFNQVRDRINALPNHGIIVDTKARGDDIMAVYFDGDGSIDDSSIRAALNRAIDNI